MNAIAAAIIAIVSIGIVFAARYTI